MRINRVWVAGSVMALAITATVLLGGSATARSRRALAQSSPAWARSSNLERHATGKVGFSLVLPWRHTGALRRLDNAVASPSSSEYTHYLSPSAFRARFAPTVDDVRVAKRWLRSHGFRVTGSSKSGILVSASGAVGRAERAFGTRLNVYRHAGDDLRAPANPVSLPPGLASTATGVIGLDQTIAHPAAPPPPAFVNAPPCSRSWGEKVAYSKPLAYGQTQPYATCGYRPAQLRGAYGLTRRAVRKDDGSGQKVAILDAFAAPTMNADLQTYSRRHGLPPAKFSQKVFHGCRVGCDIAEQQGWYGEETLDVEAVHTMAPGARIKYIGGADPGPGLTEALAYAVDHKVAAIATNSYGYLGEDIPRSVVEVQQQIFQQAISEGMGLYFSSGDDGDEQAALGHTSADFPGSSPDVTAVGGTTLGVGPSDNYRFEVGWGTMVTGQAGNTWSPPPPGDFLYGSGGGTSRLFGEPGYQRKVVPAALAHRYGGVGRVVPDIAMDGDPNSGMLVGETQTFPGGSVRYDEYRIGGTSLSSPLFAGYMAVADQRAGFHHGFVNPTLYGLSGTRAIRDVRPSPTQIAVVRNDFNNGVDRSGGVSTTLRSADLDGTLHTTKGYDDVTGLGSPGSARLLKALGN
jgi:subtilase family serine protease